MITKVLIRLPEDLGHDLPIRTFFESPTVEGLASALEKRSETTSSIDFEAESVLDPEIQPSWLQLHSATDEPETVLLTGASGFLGAYLLHDLLERTRATVLSLVRARRSGRKGAHPATPRFLRPGEHPLRRPRECDPGRFIQTYAWTRSRRIPTTRSHLDAIYHNGAEVSFFEPYERLKAPNVLGTREVIRLASFGKKKAIQYVSTISVLENWTSEEAADDPPLEAGGYPQSKWVAERLLHAATSRGIPAAIYRPGTITGDSRTGACNENDFLHRFLRGCTAMESVPAISMTVDLLPLNYVSAAIVAMSLQQNCDGRVFHLLSPDPVPMGRIFEWMRQLGFTIAESPYSEWRGRLDQLGGIANHPLAPLASFFPRIAPGERFEVTRAKFDSANTLESLAGTGIECPAPSKRLMSTYLDRLVATGAIRRPS